MLFGSGRKRRRPTGAAETETVGGAAAERVAKRRRTQTAKKGGGGSENIVSAMAQRLKGAQFRQINETLYTRPGREALGLFRRDPALFCVYHDGFSQQLSKWPVNPLDGIIAFLNRSAPKDAVVADLGCGCARLAAEVRQKRVFSFDFVAANPRVTACDMAHVPLTDASVDVAVFCLSLMGPRQEEYVLEAHRILRPHGTLLVAEVASRFQDNSPHVFVRSMRALGFDLVRHSGSSNDDDDAQYFYRLDFAKSDRLPRRVAIALAPCKYKRR